MVRSFVVLSALLLSVPALARTNAAAFEGALLHADTPLRVQHAAVYFQQGGETPTPVEAMTREQLQSEYQRLDTARPGIGGPVALLSVGGGLFLGGLGFLYFGLLDLIALGTRGAYALVGYIFLVFGAALAITGGVLIAVGLVKLFQRISERGAISQRMDDINARLESLDRTGPPPGDLPPPPPSPPGAGFFDVRPQYVIATF